MQRCRSLKLLWYVVWYPLGDLKATIEQIINLKYFRAHIWLQPPTPFPRTARATPSWQPWEYPKEPSFLPASACVPYRGHEVMGVHRYREGSCRGLRARLRRSESLFGVWLCHRAAIGVPCITKTTRDRIHRCLCLIPFLHKLSDYSVL